AAIDAAERPWIVFDFQQLQLVAWPQAHDRAVAVLPERHDAHVGSGAYRGILRARRARGQRGDRWHHRLTRHQGDAEESEPARYDHQSGEDRRGVLVSPHAGPVVLDPRTSAHT